jgi:hypothetical protein
MELPILDLARKRTDEVRDCRSALKKVATVPCVQLSVLALSDQLVMAEPILCHPLLLVRTFVETSQELDVLVPWDETCE